MIRTHGDLHLGRVARTNQGWVVADWLPGGVGAAGDALFRSPLADVADMLWSLHHVARRRRSTSAIAAVRRGPRAGRPGLGGAQPPGLPRRLPGDPGHRGARAGATGPLLDELVAVFELEQFARRAAGAPVP